MKLLTELFESHVIQEAQDDGSKKLYIEGIFLQQAVKNGNGRIYPPAVLERAVAAYSQEKIVTKRAMGELGHPEGPSVNLHRVSHLVTEHRQDGNNHIGKALIIDTPYGKIAESLIQAGVKLGVSSRGLGSLKEDRALGAKIVQNDYRLTVMIDLVADPSAPNAFVDGIMENVQFRMTELGEWVAESMEDARRAIHRTSAKELAEAKAQQWGKFLRNVREHMEVEDLAARAGVTHREATTALEYARVKARADGFEHDNRHVYTLAHQRLKGK